MLHGLRLKGVVEPARPWPTRSTCRSPTGRAAARRRWPTRAWSLATRACSPAGRLTPDGPGRARAPARRAGRRRTAPGPRSRTPTTASAASTPACLDVCSRWQVRDGDGAPVVNDHADADHDAAVVGELGACHDRVTPVCADLGDALDRFGRYGPRLGHAVERCGPATPTGSPSRSCRATTRCGSSCTRTCSPPSASTEREAASVPPAGRGPPDGQRPLRPGPHRHGHAVRRRRRRSTSTARPTLARWLVDHGNDGLVVAGTTGEAPTLTDDEKVELWRAVREAVDVPDHRRHRAATTPATRIGLTQRAAEAGVDGAARWSRRTTTGRPRPGIEAHFRAVAAATDLPVVHLRRPGPHRRAHAPPTIVLRLADEVPNIVGAQGRRPATRPATRAAHRRGARRLRASTAATTRSTLPLLAVGAVGVIGVATHWAAQQYGRDDRRASRRATSTRHGRSTHRCSSRTRFEATPTTAPFSGADQGDAARSSALPAGQCRLAARPGARRASRNGPARVLDRLVRGS